jgi:nucleotide-binding universal stress UspA family protein
MYKNILVAVDGEELSNKALTQAIGLAKAIGAKITVLSSRRPRPRSLKS